MELSTFGQAISEKDWKDPFDFKARSGMLKCEIYLPIISKLHIQV